MEKERPLKREDIYTRITNEIIKAIEAGVCDFRMPWHQFASRGLPRNAVTQSYYHGVNTLTLWCTSYLRGYTSAHWASYRQWKSLGAQVRKGERSSPIIFYKKQEPKKEEDDKDKARLVICSSLVFCADQVEGWKKEEPPLMDHTRQIEAMDAFINSLGATVRYGGDVAAYSRAFDRIDMPERKRFKDTETSSATDSFYSTLLHEHIHWTGHPKRLARDLTGRFGTSAYAMEELVAELGAAYLCAELGLSTSPRHDHAAYIRSWLHVLKEEKTAIITASSSAMGACRYLAKLVESNQESTSAKS